MVKGFGWTHVFSVHDTEGVDLPEAPTLPSLALDDAERILDVLVVRASQALNCTITLMLGEPPLGHSGAMGWANYKTREVFVVDSPKYSAADKLATLLHELAHIEDPEISVDVLRERREFVAESTAYVVGEAIGFDMSEAVSTYLAMYSATENGLLEVIHRVGKASSRIVPIVEAALAEVREQVPCAAS